MSSLVRQIFQEGRQIRALDDGARAILANLQAPFPDRLVDGSLAERGKCCIAARIEHRDSEILKSIIKQLQRAVWPPFRASRSRPIRPMCRDLSEIRRRQCQYCRDGDRRMGSTIAWRPAAWLRRRIRDSCFRSARLRRPRRKTTYFRASTSSHRRRNAVRSRGITFSSTALCAHACCLSCSARRFSATSRYSGATVVGSTSFCAKAGTVNNERTNAVRMTGFKVAPAKYEFVQ
jgi:hypothetical protein